jgi:hypothetical protein
VVQGVYGNLFAGVPAVIVFFVISGFCIHYPFRKADRLPLAAFFARRYTRILLPMAAAVILAEPLGIKLTLFQNSILWSLLAELIYYTLYPALRLWWTRWGWLPLIIGSFLIASATAALWAPTATDYTPFGPPLAWLVALPCWLLGCLLADMTYHLTTPSPRRMWTWRLGIWALSSACSVLRFHSSIGYPWTLNLFGIAVFFWLRNEIPYSRIHPPVGWLERAGQWSYSVYLLHLVANAGFYQLELPNFGHTLNWAIRVGFILLSSYAFYRIAERPSHHLARWLGQRLNPTEGR